MQTLCVMDDEKKEGGCILQRGKVLYIATSYILTRYIIYSYIYYSYIVLIVYFRHCSVSRQPVFTLLSLYSYVASYTKETGGPVAVTVAIAS